MNQRKHGCHRLTRFAVKIGSILLLMLGAHWTMAEKPVVTLKSTVTGNQEQPKVLYIVPWKANVGPEALNQNLSSQMEKVFAHIERPELQREIYFAKHTQAETNSVISDE